MFAVTALPASYGDCFWIEYGDPQAPHIILIDAGPSAPDGLKKRLENLAARGGALELVVVTHVDADHIAGMLKLLEADFYGVPVRDFWFNGFRHLPDEGFGPKQGEKLTALILAKQHAWNVAMGNAALQVDERNPVRFTLPGEATITLLSPDEHQLRVLQREWVKVCDEAGLHDHITAATEFVGGDGKEAFGGSPPDVTKLASEPFIEDKAEANGSSIAFVLEHAGKKVLFGADAFPSRLLKSLRLTGTAPFDFDLVKLPHHGSENNVSVELIEALRCPRYLFSSSGAKFKHPSPEAVARVVKHGRRPEVIFNYQSAFTAPWGNAFLQAQFGYKPMYGAGDGFTVELT